MASRPSRAAAAKARQSFTATSPAGSHASSGSLSPESRRLAYDAQQDDDSAEEFQLGSPRKHAGSDDEVDVESEEEEPDDDDEDEEEEEDDDDDEDDDSGRVITGGARSTAKRPVQSSQKQRRATQGAASAPKGVKGPKLSERHSLFGGRRAQDDGERVSRLPAHFVPKRCPALVKAGMATSSKVTLEAMDSSVWPHRGVRKSGAPNLADVAWWPGKHRADAKGEAWTSAIDQGGSVQREDGQVGLPLVHEALSIAQLEVLSAEQAEPYVAASQDFTPVPPLHPPVEAEADASPLNFAEVPPQAGEEISVAVGVQKMVEAKLAKGESEQLDHVQGSHIFNTGGHVYSLEFAPVPVHLVEPKEYLAIATSKRPLERTLLAQPQKSHGIVQLWSIAETAELEMTVCMDLGIATQVSWCPAGHDYRSQKSQSTLRRLGLLACVFQSGVVAVFAVPHPDDVERSEEEEEELYVKLAPVFSIELPGSSLTCLSWAGGEALAAGTDKGYIGVWSIGDALRSGRTTARPTHYFPVHEAAVSRVSWQMQPPLRSKDGKPMIDELPHTLLSIGLDCDGILTNIYDPHARAVMQHTRSVPYSLAWIWQLQQSLLEQENNVRVAHSRSDNYGATHRVGDCGSRNLALATSPHHPWAAAGTADGSVVLIHLLNSVLSRSLMPHEPLWRLAHNRATGALRMVDQIMPSQHSGEDTPASAAWHPAVSVNSVAFSPNIGRAWLVAGGTSCGLVRVDWASKGEAADGQQGDNDDD